MIRNMILQFRTGGCDGDVIYECTRSYERMSYHGGNEFYVDGELNLFNSDKKADHVTEIPSDDPLHKVLYEARVDDAKSDLNIGIDPRSSKSSLQSLMNYTGEYKILDKDIYEKHAEITQKYLDLSIKYSELADKYVDLKLNGCK